MSAVGGFQWWYERLVNETVCSHYLFSMSVALSNLQEDYSRLRTIMLAWWIILVLNLCV